MTRFGGTRRVAAATASALLAALALGVAPAGAADPVPVGIMDAYATAGLTVRGCDGRDTVRPGYGEVVLLAAADVPRPVVIPVTLAGPPAAALVDPPTEVVLDGSGVAFVDLHLARVQEGTLTVTLGTGAGYVLDQSVVEVVFGPPEVAVDCTAPLASGHARQTVRVGEAPAPYDLAGGGAATAGAVLDPGGAIASYGASVQLGGVDGGPVDDAFDTPVAGGLPPGLAYVDDRWAGAATTPGTYRFRVHLCAEVDPGGAEPAPLPSAPAPEVGGRAAPAVPLCFGTLDAEVTVLAAADDAPGGGVPGGGAPGGAAVAPAAVPVPGAARFTG